MGETVEIRLFRISRQRKKNGDPVSRIAVHYFFAKPRYFAFITLAFALATAVILIIRRTVAAGVRI